jgi:hypothetical protein
MKQITLAFALFLLINFHSFGQNNPIANLTWDYHYNWGNYYDLHWEEPALPHGELIGYNIYRENELYRFQTENNMYYLEQGSNCPGDFQYYTDNQGFYAHVTAVYNPGQVESTYLETIFISGPALKNNEFEKQKAIVYPNPSKGLVTIGNENLTEIQLYDSTGKKIKTFKPQPQIDLSDLAKGVYLIKLVAHDRILVDKIILE